VDRWEQITQRLVFYILALVEKDVSVFFEEPIFRESNSVLIVIPVPLAIEWVFNAADVVTECQRAIVIYEASEVVFGRIVQFRLQLEIVNVRTHIEIIDREVDVSLQLSPLAFHVFEPFKLNDQNRRWSRNFELFGVRRQFFALRAKDGIHELLQFVKVYQAVVKADGARKVFAILVIDGFVLLNIHARLIVVTFNHLRVPFDGDVTLLKEESDLLIGRLNYTATALFDPGTLTALVSLSVNGLQDERLNALLAFL
jgi:hypothetical protein